jgi:hypothetical protein
MLKLHHIGLWLLFLLALSCDSWAQSSRQPPKQESPATQQQPANEQRGTEHAPFIVQIQKPEQAQPKTTADTDKGPKQRSGNWFSGWTLSEKIAGIASVAAFLQFVALLVTIGVMVLNGRRQLRAYVFIENAGLYEGTMLNPPMAVHQNEPGIVINFKNTGQTPAYRVISWTRIEIAEPINEEKLVVPPLAEIYPTNLGPGGTMPKTLWFGRALTPGEITDIATGVRAIYVYGRLEYYDAFKRKQHTVFRAKYAGAFPPAQGVIFIHCEKGNEAT